MQKGRERPRSAYEVPGMSIAMRDRGEEMIPLKCNPIVIVCMAV